MKRQWHKSSINNIFEQHDDTFDTNEFKLDDETTDLSMDDETTDHSMEDETINLSMDDDQQKLLEMRLRCDW